MTRRPRRPRARRAKTIGQHRIARLSPTAFRIERVTRGGLWVRVASADSWAGAEEIVRDLAAQEKAAPPREPRKPKPDRRLKAEYTGASMRKIRQNIRAGGLSRDAESLVRGSLDAPLGLRLVSSQALTGWRRD